MTIERVWNWLAEDYYKRLLYILSAGVLLCIFILVGSYIYNIDDKESYSYGTFMPDYCIIGNDSELILTVNGKYEEKLSLFDMMFSSIMSMTKYGDYIDLAQSYSQLCDSIKVKEVTLKLPKEAGYVSLDTSDFAFSQNKSNDLSYELYQWGTTYRKKYSGKECTEMNFIIILSKRDVIWVQIETNGKLSGSITAYKGYINESNQ